MQRVCAEFEAQHPGVEVVWIDVPFDALNRKLVAAAASGRAPDVVNLSDRDFARYAALDALQPIDDYLAQPADQTYLPGAANALRLRDQQLALPWYLTTSVRMVNTERLARAGLTPDTLGETWTELAEQARGYFEGTGEFLFTAPLGDSSVLPGELLAEGIVPFREVDGRLVADLTKREVVGYIEQWISLYRDGVLPRAAATRGHEHLVELYQNQRVAVIQTGPNMLSRVRDANAEVYATTQVLPPITGSLGRSHIAMMCLAVTRQSDHPDLATQLALHVTSAMNQAELARRATVLPSTQDTKPFAQVDISAEPDAVRLHEARQISAASLPGAVAFTPAIEAWPDLRRAFDEGIKEALLGGQPVEPTLRRIEDRWNRLLDANRPVGLDAIPQPKALNRSGPASRELP